MNDLTPEEEGELAATVWEFVQDRKYDGLVCAVIISGRGIRKVSYALEDRDKVPKMLALAFRDVGASMDEQDAMSEKYWQGKAN